MKEKIRAILNSELNIEGKVDVLYSMLQTTAEKYKSWAVERDDMVMSLGFKAFEDDCALPPTEIWERFINDLNNKE